jgi:hypothetical protein
VDLFTRHYFCECTFRALPSSNNKCLANWCNIASSGVFVKFPMVATKNPWHLGRTVTEACLFFGKNPRFKRHLTGTMERTFYVFSKGLKVETKVIQRTVLNMSSFCKDNHFGTEVCLQESWPNLNPNVVLLSMGIYHFDGLYPGNAKKPPMFVVRSCRVSSGRCKRRLHPSEVLCLYDISNIVCRSLSAEIK